MKASEIVKALYSYNCSKELEETCDVLKAGSPDKEVGKIAVTMMPTVAVIREAEKWGADLLIVHEPLYYNHMDNHTEETIENEKRKIVENSGMTIYRYHDFAHYSHSDIIIDGLIRAMGLEGETEDAGTFAVKRIHLKEPKTPAEIAQIIEKNLNAHHIRIAGLTDVPCSLVSVTPGAIGPYLKKELENPESEIVLAGEISEWAIAEYVRDAVALGHKKSLLVLGHAVSERDGMMLTSEVIKELFPQLETKYFDCGDVYTN